ncbi:MAG TPA: hypothetical protein VLZ12_16165 [Verrucomicrobiae bacterium]|nr:hypothetical protein [Verrucomicrobiae bacterium]
MSVNLDNLFRAARDATRDTTRAELGFETRLLARIRAERAQATPWFAFAWKLLPAFAAIVIALGVWNYAAASAVDLPTAIVGNTDESALASYLTGESQ